MLCVFLQFSRAGTVITFPWCGRDCKHANAAELKKSPRFQKLCGAQQPLATHVVRNCKVDIGLGAE